jgi:hypothetical protein
MTVLPNAPIDSATGLPVPTIAVATDGGVSVIKDDGTVADILFNSYGFNKVEFQGTEHILAGTRNLGPGASALYVNVYPIPSADVGATMVDEFIVSRSAGTDNGASASIRVPFGDGANAISSNGNTTSFIGSNEGLLHYTPSFNDTTATSSMGVGITTDYNTGWMNGDIKLATLSDTDDTDVTGSELVTNGTFDSDTSWTKGAGWTISGGGAVASNVQSGIKIRSTSFTLATGWHTITVDVNTSASTYYFGVDGTTNDNTGVLSTQGMASFTVYLLAGTYTAYIGAWSSGLSGTFDNFSVRKAEEDRSVNGNGLQVFGTVNKNPVATGADLVAYSAFSGNNYLEQPYNSDLNFGTGDFFATVWVKPDTMNSYNYIFDKADSDGTNRFALYVTPSNVAGGAIEFYTPAHPSKYSNSIPTGVWTHVAWVRKNNTSYGYINGELQTQFYSDENLTGDSTAQLYVGVRYTKNTSSSLNEGSISLLRISATAPSPEQIKKIYEDEKVLFQENAQATLYGTSNAVTALAYDDSTELLHVGTSNGRSVFQGLKRIDNTTDAVGSAISASNGLVAED